MVSRNVRGGYEVILGENVRLGRHCQVESCRRPVLGSLGMFSLSL